MNNKKNTSILEYLNLDLSKIPKEIKNKDDIDIKASEISTGNNYKVYEHVSIKDINIVITNARRLDLASQKIDNMNDLSYYLNPKNQEEYECFLNLLRNTSIKDIEKIEKFQQSFKDTETSKVKYNKDYLWQIYYIERTNKYFMIVPIQEMENQCLFYIIKKKIEKSKGKIYVPICNKNYSSSLLESSKFNNLSSNLFFLTKEWPLIYEVYNNKNDIYISITGNIEIVDNLRSDYRIIFEVKEDLIDFYNLIKTIVHLQTELSNYYTFDLIIDKKGSLHFYYEGNEITIESLKDFYLKEIKQSLKNIDDIEKIQMNLTKKLNEMKIEEKELNTELSNKQKQIATFLECKKTFLGRIKYYFKYNKKQLTEKEINISEAEPTVIENAGKITPIYTNNLEDLIYICKDLRTKTTVAATTRLDIQNLNIKIDILKKKIKNATKYIEEIDLHKKSIFEFWKFTNKDEKNQLSEGIVKKEENQQIEKKFNLNDDLEKLANYLDKTQRKKLNFEEQNAIFIGATIGMDNITKQEQNLVDIISNNRLEVIKFDALNHREQAKTFENVVGKSFDELSPKDISMILKNVYKNLNNAFKKCALDINLPVYSLEKPENKIMAFEINPKNLVLEGNKKEIYKIDLKKGTNVLALSNIILFNNRNDTLPIGMDYSTQIFIDLRKTNIIEKNKKSNNIIKLSENLKSFKTTQIYLTEYII